MATEEKEHKEAEGAEKPKSKKMLIIIIAVVVVIGAAGAFFLLGGKKKSGEGEEAEAAHEEEHKHYETAKLDTFIVNLSQSGSFLKTTILLEFDPVLAVEKGHGEAKAEGGGGGHGGGGETSLPGILGHREPMIKDAIIRLLSSKKGEEVLSPEGKETMKEELIDAINEATGAEEPPVIGIYFSEFLVQ
jgi:flagellar protein FliL